MATLTVLFLVLTFAALSFSELNRDEFPWDQGSGATCVNIPLPHNISAFIYYGPTLGVMWQDWYWEIVFSHEHGHVSITRPPKPLSEMWTGIEPASQQLTAALAHAGKVYIFQKYLPQKLKILEYRYDPGEKRNPEFIAEHRKGDNTPEAKFFLDPPQFGNVSVIFTTPHPEQNATVVLNRVLWLNTQNSRAPISAFTGVLKEKSINHSDLIADFKFKLLDETLNTIDPKLLTTMVQLRGMELNKLSDKKETQIASVKRFKLTGNQSYSFSYLNFYYLTINSGFWVFRPETSFILDVGIVFGCPQTFCLDTTMDTALAMPMKEPKSNSVFYYVFIIRGRYLMRLKVDRPFKLPYLDVEDLFDTPFTSKEDGIMPLSKLNIGFVRGGLAIHTKDKDKVIIALFSTDQKYHVYLWYPKNGKNFSIDSNDSGDLEDLFLGVDRLEEGIDSVWHNTVEDLFYINVAAWTYQCNVTLGKTDFTPIIGFMCSPFEPRPRGFRREITTVLSYPNLAESVFLSHSFYWKVRADNANWTDEEYEPTLVHEKPSLFDLTSAKKVCRYDSVYPLIKSEEVWTHMSQLRERSLPVPPGSATTESTPTDADEASKAFTAVLGYYVFYIISLIIIVAALMAVYRKLMGYAHSRLDSTSSVSSLYKKQKTASKSTGSTSSGSDSLKEESSSTRSQLNIAGKAVKVFDIGSI